ncbi:hypothetical protein O9H85_33435 [Paenibacillus filicis]|uniref:Uncharacterized protein n=1 Tax=Paenibacillus gyeongsangnamensis TaxID=3388067 RepID=A0ABT4QJW1_9BACL|nr:hypothetical protein [Paenibacillus filicis]MCZ8517168.1 hypothetical protein [Paenibacillus filicis]
MLKRWWIWGPLMLLALFAYLLLQFFFSTLRIRHAVEPLEARQSGDGRLRHVVLISQELDNPFWRSVEQRNR